MNRFIALGAIVILALFDQATKALVLRFIPFQDSIPIIPGFFNLTHLYNTGAAFGMLHDSNRLFILISTAAFVGLILMREHFIGLLMQWGWVLLLAGILGNITDRLVRGHVVDFLDFQLGVYHWPSFNIADSCICIAAGLFLLGSFQSPIKLNKR